MSMFCRAFLYGKTIQFFHIVILIVASAFADVAAQVIPGKITYNIFSHARIRNRSAASPEGSIEGNLRLSQGRRDALGKIFLPGQPVKNDSVKRERLSLKTNLLQDVAYVPQYGFAPIWNIQLEYYPLRGHWTYGASLDIPWWQNQKKEHKYFQIRNWQIETRRYFQESGSFRGWYAQAYANAGKYGIGFSDTKGWQGEGWGAGLGAGYVWRLGKKREAVRLPDGQLWTDRHHWRLEAGIQVGYFRTKYDPYVYGDPVDRHEDELYYYDWLGLAKDFKRRQYLFTWLGPTRIGITLTYDIFYRKQRKKGASQ